MIDKRKKATDKYLDYRKRKEKEAQVKMKKLDQGRPLEAVWHLGWTGTVVRL